MLQEHPCAKHNHNIKGAMSCERHSFLYSRESRETSYGQGFNPDQQLYYTIPYGTFMPADFSQTANQICIHPPNVFKSK